MKWLDTETKSFFDSQPPDRFAPADTVAVTLVMLTHYGRDHHALSRAVQRVAGLAYGEAERLLRQRFPTIVAPGLAYLDALIGQLELICCDAVSVVIPDTVIAYASADYLVGLYGKLRRSDEFQVVNVQIESIPESPSGQTFCDRFLHGKRPPLPAVMRTMRKKARVMRHLGEKIGVRLETPETEEV